MSVYVAVCGPGEAGEEERALAEEVGRRLAQAGAIVVCGGLGGVMDAAAGGARAAGGITVGLLPGNARTGASPHLSVALPTGMGEARNALIVRVADAVIAIGGGYGTLSEIALARKVGKPVVGLETWEVGREGHVEAVVERAGTAEEAVRVALARAGR